jgi:hypothetical protein
MKKRKILYMILLSMLVVNVVQLSSSYDTTVIYSLLSSHGLGDL